ncbi:unnamed protein product [Symbiodinium natans]|uniref:Uncharacterized protein n=1 Tax=Symbiodinium natans TaxID=878477 RepID=A0A812MSB2_9DINO|nr:unnamed protein product [Symbiodinium natans]
MRPSRAPPKQEAQKARALPNLQKSASVPAVQRHGQPVQREGQQLPRLLGSSSQPAVRESKDKGDKGEQKQKERNDRNAERAKVKEPRPSEKKSDAKKLDHPKSAVVKPEGDKVEAKAAKADGKAKEDVEIVATREMRRELLEVLSNPQIREIAAKYYNAQLRGSRGTGRLGFRELRHVLRALNQHFGLPVPAAPMAQR